MSKETGLDFASKVDGRMYSCGHDAHTAMLATAAHLLCGRRHAAVAFEFLNHAPIADSGL